MCLGSRCIRPLPPNAQTHNKQKISVVYLHSFDTLVLTECTSGLSAEERLKSRLLAPPYKPTQDSGTAAGRLPSLPLRCCTGPPAADPSHWLGRQADISIPWPCRSCSGDSASTPITPRVTPSPCTPPNPPQSGATYSVCAVAHVRSCPPKKRHGLCLLAPS